MPKLAEPSRPAYPLHARPGRRVGAITAFWLRLRLRHTCAGIDRLESGLAGEFGLSETAPLHRELENLYADRDRLIRRLARGG